MRTKQPSWTGYNETVTELSEVAPRISAHHIVIQRKRRGLTQAQLAEAVGVSDRAVRAWESGDSSPRGDVRMRLAAYLGLDGGKPPRVRQDLRALERRLSSLEDAAAHLLKEIEAVKRLMP